MVVVHKSRVKEQGFILLGVGKRIRLEGEKICTQRHLKCIFSGAS